MNATKWGLDQDVKPSTCFTFALVSQQHRPEALNGKLLEGPKVPNRSAKLAQLKARCGCAANRVLSLGYLGDENQHLCMFMDVYKDLYSTMMYYFFEMNTQLPAILGRTLIRSKATVHPPSSSINSGARKVSNIFQAPRIGDSASTSARGGRQTKCWSTWALQGHLSVSKIRPLKIEAFDRRNAIQFWSRRNRSLKAMCPVFVVKQLSTCFDIFWLCIWI